MLSLRGIGRGIGRGILVAFGLGRWPASPPVGDLVSDARFIASAPMSFSSQMPVRDFLNDEVELITGPDRPLDLTASLPTKYPN